MDLSKLLHLEDKLIFLVNINGEKLGVLNTHDTKFSPRFNNISTLEFTIYEDECDYYDLLTSYMRIELQDICVFQLQKPIENNDGLRKSKHCIANSLEWDINRKMIAYLSGTYKFYSIDPSEETIMKIIMNKLPNWSIGTIDSNLWNVYRTFDLENISLYNFMLENVEESYEMVFEFDSINRTISAIAFENVPKSCDIFLSFDNLVNNIEIIEDTESLVTSIEVYGANKEIGINLVNPLGNTIYNFQHFTGKIGKSSDNKYMSDNLITALGDWQELIDSYQESYSTYLISRITKISERIVLESELVTLQGEYDAIEVTRDSLLDSGLNATEQNTLLKAKLVEINNKKSNIIAKQAEIDAIDEELQTIQNTVSLTSYFTPSQLLELDNFDIHTTVTDENYVISSLDTDLDLQNMAQDLYDRYKRYLDKNSKLKKTFSISLANFLTQKAYKSFTQQMDWGITIALNCTDDDTIYYPMLLGLDINLDDDSDVQFIFGEELRYESSAMSHEDYLANQLSNVANTVNGSRIDWGKYTSSGNSDRLDNIFKNGLSADLIPIRNADNEEITLSKNGLLGRRSDGSGGFDDEQVKLIHNKLAFTSDGWNTLRTVLGKITMPDGSLAFGLNAEVILGSLIASNSLLITNSNGKFVVDSNGATLTDASLEILGNNGLNRILLDPDNGFKIQKSTESGWVDVAYLDNEGNAIFEANLDVKSININNQFIVDTLGNVTMNGTLDIGDGKLTFTGGTLTVKGDIVADDLFLYIDGVKTSIIDELTGKIDGQYITGGMSGTTALGNLLVDNLSTSDKIRNYLASNTAQVNYIRIYDQYIEFVEATYSGGTTQARTGDKTGDLLYWTDDTYNFVTSVTDGSLSPVMVYTYTELIKGKYGYELVDGVNQPSIVLGAGTGTGDNGKTFIYKGTDGFYIDYRNSVTGESTIFKITDNGIDLSQFTSVTYNENTTVSGMIQIWVQPDEPLQAKEKDLWVDTDDFTRYDKSDISANTTLLESDNELIKATGMITITLHPATIAGIVKYIRNVGTGIVTLVGTINGQTNMILYPDESVALKTEGDGWGIY